MSARTVARIPRAPVVLVATAILLAGTLGMAVPASAASPGPSGSALAPIGQVTPTTLRPGVPSTNHAVLARPFLTLDPGAILKFQSDFCGTIAGLFVDGTLNAVGTAGSPIVFTSYRDDAPDARGDTNGDGSATSPAKGDWERIKFSSLSTGSVMSYCVVRYGGRASVSGCGGVSVPMIDVVGSTPQFDHCTFSNAFVQGLSFTAGSTAGVSNSSSESPAPIHRVVQLRVAELAARPARTIFAPP